MPSTTNFGWTTPADTDLVKDGAAAIRTLGNGVDSSFVDLKGGTTGQILSKNSNTDLDFVWIANDQGDITAVTAGTGISGGGTSGAVTITNSMATEITASGDIIVGTGSGTFDNLPIGSTGQVLTADTTVSPYKVKWATVAATLTIAQIATGTLSGSSVTISNLSSYNDLWIRLLNVNPSAASVTFIRPNNNTTVANYVQSGGYAAAGATGVITTSGFGAIGYNIQTDLHATSISNAGVIHLSNCKNAGFTTFDSTVSYNNSANTIYFEQTQGIYLVSEAVSSIVIAPSGGTYDGGTYTIWGA